MAEAIARPVALAADSVPPASAANVPEPYRPLIAGRLRRRLGDVFALDQFGVNLVELAPGARSSFRHWHAREDEFVYVLSGELVLVTEAGEANLGAGMCAGFKAGVRDAHHLLNRGPVTARYLEVGTRDEDDLCVYPDDDLKQVVDADGLHLLHKDGRPY